MAEVHTYVQPIPEPLVEQFLDITGLTPTEAEIIAVALSKADQSLRDKDRDNGTNWADLADHIKRSLFKRTRGYAKPQDPNLVRRTTAFTIRNLDEQTEV